MIESYQDEMQVAPAETLQTGDYVLATVSAVSGSTATLLIDGEDTASQKYYRCVTGLSPTVGARVLALRISGTLLILAKI